MNSIETMFGMLGVIAVDALCWIVVALCLVGILLVLQWGFRGDLKPPRT